MQETGKSGLKVESSRVDCPCRLGDLENLSYDEYVNRCPYYRRVWFSKPVGAMAFWERCKLDGWWCDWKGNKSKCSKVKESS